MEYFDTLPVEVGWEFLSKEMFSRFEENELGLSLRSKLYHVAPKKGGSMEEFAERVTCMSVRAFPFLGRAGVELYSIEFFLKGLGNKRTSLAFLDKVPDSIEKAVDWAKNFEANVSWVGEDSKARVVEEMTDKYTGWREEIKGEGVFRVEKWATWRGLVLGMHGVRTGKMGSREKDGLVWQGVEEGVLDVEKRAIM